MEATVMMSESVVLYSTGAGLVEPYRLLDRLSATMVRLPASQGPGMTPWTAILRSGQRREPGPWRT